MRTHLVSLLVLLTLAACGQREEPPQVTEAPTATEAAAEAPAAAEAETQAPAAIDAPLPTAAPEAAPAAEPDVGRLKYAANCLSCHGATGQGMGPFPKLAGQSAEEIAGKLMDYRAGKTLGAQTATMAPFAKAMSEAEIEAVARYVAAF
jgi:mono/diheme cytochrome c family protein